MAVDEVADDAAKQGRPAGSALYRYVQAWLDLRANIGKGLFAAIILIAYLLVAIQVVVIARGDLNMTRALLEASSVGSLLVTIPAMVMLPVAGYLAATQLFCYILGKANQRIAGFGVLIYPLFFSLGVGLFAILLYLPTVVSAVALGVFAIVLVGSPRWIRPSASTPLAPGHWKADVAASCLRYTDVWSKDSADEIVLSDERPQVRFRVGALAAGFTLVLLGSAVFPRFWVPPRALQLRSTIGHLHLDAGCASPVGPPDGKVVVGFTIGSQGNAVVVKDIKQQCLVTVPENEIVVSVVCRGDRAWYARTPIEVWTGSDLETRSCSEVRTELGS